MAEKLQRAKPKRYNTTCVQFFIFMGGPRRLTFFFFLCQHGLLHYFARKSTVDCSGCIKMAAVFFCHL